MTRPLRRGAPPIALVFAALALAACPGGDRTASDRDAQSRRDGGGDDGDGRAVELYFPGQDGKLHRETRRIAAGIESTEAVVEAVVAAVIEGPREERLHAPLPQLAALLEAAAAEASAGEAGNGGGDDTGATDVDEVEGEDVPAGGPPPPSAPPPPALGVYLIDDTVYVDLPAPASRPAIGARQELLMLYSLVNSVLANAPEARRMVVLWDGEQPLTFAGHIDTGRPLLPQPSLVAE